MISPTVSFITIAKYSEPSLHISNKNFYRHSSLNDGLEMLMEMGDEIVVASFTRTEKSSEPPLMKKLITSSLDSGNFHSRTFSPFPR